jgi:Holliday junction resolvase RusA-like endonuclease
LKALGSHPAVPDDGLPRTWTLELPAGMEMLSLNGREHWAARNRKTQALKQAAWVLAKQAKIPRLERASITVEYQPPDRRRRDADNTCAASGKACADGLVAAGVLEDDECPRYVTGIWCTIGERYPQGRLVLHVTEVAATGGDAA